MGVAVDPYPHDAQDLDVDVRLSISRRAHAALMAQLAADTQLLQALHVMDYSLLLGLHFPRWGADRWFPPHSPAVRALTLCAEANAWFFRLCKRILEVQLRCMHWEADLEYMHACAIQAAAKTGKQQVHPRSNGAAAPAAGAPSAPPHADAGKEPRSAEHAPAEPPAHAAVPGPAVPAAATTERRGRNGPAGAPGLNACGSIPRVSEADEAGAGWGARYDDLLLRAAAGTGPLSLLERHHVHRCGIWELCLTCSKARWVQQSLQAPAGAAVLCESRRLRRTGWVCRRSGQPKHESEAPHLHGR